ncbi:response regulator [bacterium D16-51]|nr:response regulator [bacterium D16-59]RKI62120.1 response regulator [bacterium D16-51]
MEYFNQNKQNLRNTERFVAIFFSLYSINLCISVIRQKQDAWIPVCIFITALASWAIFLSKYKTFRTRAAITTLLIQSNIIIYATHTNDLHAVIPTFMVLTVLVAFYGSAKLQWLTLISLFYIIFYHGVITSSFSLASKETLFNLLPQTGNILCLELIIYIWIKKRNQDNEEMYQVIDALVEAEQSKDDFLANVSHEIRTPVNTICGMSEMALREHSLDKLREEVFDIRDAGHNLMALVSDILDFSQLQQGKMDLEEEAYNISSTINDVINMAMARKGDKPLEFIVDCNTEIPCELLGDEKKIRRVIMNLVDNAVKFTNEGGILINISFRKEDYGINLCVSVKDTGIGMSEESLEKLFERFCQLDTRRNRLEGGIGLGLAISRALILKMGGTITVRSRLGKGSIFRFVIPQKVLNEKPIGQLNNRENLNVATYFDMEQFDMLTVRDEYSKFIIHMVQQLKVKCHVCRNLAELKRREKLTPFSHIFISLEEYQEDATYFDRLAKHTRVITVIERYNEKYITNPDIIRLYKPFYMLPVITILNGSRGNGGGRQMVRPGKFIAPDAHVLVVDDNTMNIRVIEGLLKEYQIKVTYASSGHEALEVIENMCYDFVFMDHMMPEMDGIETMHRIRKKAGVYYQKTPIIALTANAAPGNREMFLEEGFDDFLAKPVEISVLERVLKRNLPEEKIIFQQKETINNNTPDTPISETENHAAALHQTDGENLETTEELVIGDLNVKQGMLYCGGQQQYLNVLEMYYSQEEEKRQELETLFQKQNWKDYTIKIHALKSIMKSMGADTLSRKAKALEDAGKREDIPYILNHHEEMIAEYHRVIGELRQCPFLSHVTAQKTPPGKQTGNAAIKNEREPLPELDDASFQQFLAEMEDSVYSLDGEQMLAILAKLQEYQYCRTALSEKLEPVRKKIEMSDYMSAFDTLNDIRDNLKNKTEGGSANA